MSSFSGFIILRLGAIVNVSTDIFKISLFFGIVLALFHFKEINYFPKDLTVGDGFLFILISCKFALMGAFFIGSLLIIGFFIFNFIKVLNALYKNSYKEFDRLMNFLLDFSFEKIMMFGVFVFIFPLSILFGVGFWGESWIGVLLFLANSFISYLFFYAFKKTKRDGALSGDKKYTQMSVALIFMITIPIYFYSIFMDDKKLTNFALSSLQENDKNAIYLVKKEHKDLFPENNTIEHGEYVILKNAQVVLRGFGRNALVSYMPINDKGVVSDHAEKVEVPNDGLQVKWKSSRENNNS
ncbi:hypothetical protein F892_02196 [Acinetobacter vivianii]|uniref:Uncharacterized protein n=1 Tax=Acinetobacter vivianii TaxID=1776742 RepID=N9NPI8_9GAMM|nr:hypothetical protein [Acinetobacter vivianii]ENX22953.1 hypothetical protein F892_02196 [Acinetobacter vivianii]MEB6666516.1 hypothetical protein [Acinetobacter vivianii]GGI61755.1 hypothetical protein GCM10011446_32500 [Acinetobacter vivianii]